jgi:hypothetical protein
LQFNDCFIDEDLKIGADTVFEKSFNIYSISIQKNLQVYNCTFSTCLWSLDHCQDILFSPTLFEKVSLYFSHVSLESVQVGRFNQVLNGEMLIAGDRAKIGKFHISGILREKPVSIVNIEVGTFNLRNFRNESTLGLDMIKANQGQKTEFSISESYLGNAEFNSIDLNSFDEVRIVDANLKDTSFINVKWKKPIYAFPGTIQNGDLDPELENKIKLIENRLYFNSHDKFTLESNPKVLSYYGKQRETYRQLKHSMAKQGDMINEQAFHEMEMVAYDRSLTYDENFWTKTIIKLSRVTSSFGKSIHRPLIFLLVGHFVLFSVLVVGNVYKPLRFSFTDFNLPGFITGLNYYLETINPFRKTEAGQSFMLVDISMRIWSSYMIYNIIRATRRFTK